MEMTAHLTFAGECEAAFRFYERCFGGGIVMMLSYCESPARNDVPAKWRDKIVHATLAFGDKMLAGADVLPEQYQAPAGFYILLSVDSPADAERVFRALSEGGVVRMPIQKTFWSPCFGVVVDRFGIPWEISCEEVIAAS
jgi:PhnB protein